MKDPVQFLVDNGLCCNCKSPMKTSQNFNICQVKRKATWEFPVWGNLITGEHNMAIAFICDTCLAAERPVMFVVEMRQNNLLYHPLEMLPI